MGCRWLAFGCVGLFFLAMNAQALEEVAAKAESSEKTVLVVAAKIEDLEADHYLWAAEMTAAYMDDTGRLCLGRPDAERTSASTTTSSASNTLTRSRSNASPSPVTA